MLPSPSCPPHPHVPPLTESLGPQLQGFSGSEKTTRQLALRLARHFLRLLSGEGGYAETGLDTPGSPPQPVCGQRRVSGCPTPSTPACAIPDCGAQPEILTILTKEKFFRDSKWPLVIP